MKKRRILIIDNEIEFAEKIRNVLSASSYEVYITGDCAKSLELSKILLPDLIIINSSMRKNALLSDSTLLYADPVISSFPLFLIVKNGDYKLFEWTKGHNDYDIISNPLNVRKLLKITNTFFDKLNKIEKKYEEKLDKLRSDIAFALPHEFRTSLGSIIASSNIIVQDIGNNESLSFETLDEIKIMANLINESSKQLHRLTENFLFYSQLQTIQDKYDKISDMKKFSIYNSKEIIFDVLFGHHSYSERQEDFDLNIDNHSLNISYFNFQKLVYELVDNAIKFSEKGTKIIINAQKENGQYCFSIQDFGRGMTPYQIESIGAYTQFDRYVYEQQGAGLGLIISKLLTILHNGNFDIKSELGNGTLIKVSLPISVNNIYN